MSSLTMHNQMPHYYQRIGPYADLAYHKHTVRTDGCGPVAFAMAASYLLGRSVEPPEIIAWIGNRFAGFGGRGTRPEFFREACAAYGLSCRETNSTQEAVEAVRNGFPVIYYTEKSKGLFSDVMHYLVLSGVTSDGKILIHNPNGMNEGQCFSVSEVEKFRVRRITKKAFYIIT